MADRFISIVADIARLRDYVLSDTHPRGRHKARVFRSRPGLTARDVEWLRSTLIAGAQDAEGALRATEHDDYGQRYVLDFPVSTSTGSAIVRSAWIVRKGEDVLRFLTCYVL